MIAAENRLWIEAQVRERDLPKLRAGQEAVIASDGEAWNRSAGTVVWVADYVDPQTRMGRVRISIEGDDIRLRAHQFVRVKISVDSVSDLAGIPGDAVQWEGCCNVVFVMETPDRFKPRKVQIQYEQDGFYAVSGINPGEHIVTQGSYMLKTELMKGSLGAGCCGTGA